MFKIQHIGC